MIKYLLLHTCFFFFFQNLANKCSNIIKVCFYIPINRISIVYGSQESQLPVEKLTISGPVSKGQLISNNENLTLVYHGKPQNTQTPVVRLLYSEKLTITSIVCEICYSRFPFYHIS